MESTTTRGDVTPLAAFRTGGSSECSKPATSRNASTRVPRPPANHRRPSAVRTAAATRRSRGGRDSPRFRAHPGSPSRRCSRYLLVATSSARSSGLTASRQSGCCHGPSFGAPIRWLRIPYGHTHMDVSRCLIHQARRPRCSRGSLSCSFVWRGPVPSSGSRLRRPACDHPAWSRLWATAACPPSQRRASAGR